MRFLLTSIVSLGLVGLTAVAAEAGPLLTHYVDANGDQWLYGCVTDEIGQQLIQAGFQEGIGPVPILCIESYTAVYKQLGN